MLILLQSARPGGVLSGQVLPPSSVRFTRPLSVPTQTRPSAAGDGAIAKITPKPQTVARDIGTSPSQPGAPGTAPVRSGLTVCQERPASGDRKRPWAPW